MGPRGQKRSLAKLAQVLEKGATSSLVDYMPLFTVLRAGLKLSKNKLKISLWQKNTVDIEKSTKINKTQSFISENLLLTKHKHTE